MRIKTKTLKWRQWLSCQHGALPTNSEGPWGQTIAVSLRNAWNSADQSPWKKAELNFISLLYLPLTLSQEGWGHQERGQDLFSEWERLCEAARVLVSAGLPSLHLDTENTDKEQAGTWEGSPSPSPRYLSSTWWSGAVFKAWGSKTLSRSHLLPAKPQSQPWEPLHIPYQLTAASGARPLPQKAGCFSSI